MFRRLLREYLSLTRAERRGMQVLGFLVLFLLVLRGLLPLLIQPASRGHFLPDSDFTAFQEALQERDALLKKEWVGEIPSRREPERFLFDPNTAGLDTLIRLGLSPRTARILVNYRQAGAVFDRDSDLLRVYGLSPGDFSRLQPFIRIGSGEGRESHPEDRQTSFRETDEFPGTETPKTWQPSFEETSLASFELNRADSQQLVSVFGIGPVFARRILRYRELLGGFCRPEQLLEVYGLNPGQYEELVRRIVLDTTQLRKIDLNGLDAWALSRHPYLDRYQALALVAYRDLAGPYRDPSQVKENRLLPDSIYRKIRPYLEAKR